MSLYSGLSRYNHFSEFNEPLDMGDGRILTAAQRRGLALTNLYGGGSAAVEFPGATGTGADSAGVLTFNTPETTIVVTDQLGRIEFKAGSEASGTDSILVGAAIWAEAEATFTASVNATSLVFATGASEAAAEKMRLDSEGVLRPLAWRRPVVALTDADTTLSTANSGKIHIVPDCTAARVFTLPAHAAGLEYRFWYGGAAADASSPRISCSGSGVFVGGVTFHDEDGDVSAPVFSNGSSNDFFTTNVPAGYDITVVSNGTNWLINGWIHSATVPAFADS